MEVNDDLRRYALEAAQVGVWSWHVSTGAVAWSANLEALHGLTPGTFPRTFPAFFQGIYPEDQVRVQEELDRALASSENFEMEYRIVRPDGRLCWLQGKGRVFRSGGQPLSMVGVCQEITDRKQMQEALRQGQAELEDRVRELTASWANDVAERRRLEEKLSQADKIKAIGRLAGGVAHDFNNLLTIILGFSDLLLTGLPAENPARYQAQEIKKAALRAAQLTGQLLAFGRRQVLAPQILDLNALLRETDPMIAQMLGAHIERVLELAPDLGHIEADPMQLNRVLLNLAENSRDAMPQGGRFTITTANVDLDAAYARDHGDLRPGPYVLLAVQDNGSGMSAEVRACLFEPFFTTKDVDQGTGLGLSSSYGIIKQSGGHIDVSSTLGQGTTFRIFLPRIEAPLPETEPPLAGIPGGSETVLLVEDEDLVRRYAAVALRRAGYTVLEATDGATALRLASQHAQRIHLLLTDVIMPQLGGRQLADHLAELRPGLKVLYVSGYYPKELIRDGTLPSQPVLLQKPFTVEKLTQKVREVLDSPP
jgi:PAS domain S-box-containing protein